MDRLNPWTTGIALAATFALLNAVCAIAVALWPQGTLDFFNAWFHGISLAPLQTTSKPLTVGGVLYGLVGVAATGFTVGVVYAVSYNLIRRCPGCH
jgi:hypothetical protein